MKADYILDETGEKEWFLTRTAQVTDNNCTNNKCMVQAAVYRTEGETVHLSYKKQKKKFHAMCINKLPTNESKW
jgi:hypothetical protein